MRCFRVEEARLDAEYEDIKAEMEQEMRDVDAHLARMGWTGENGEGEKGAELRVYKAECADHIVQAKAARDVGIRVFRSQQGVWGDG